MLDQLGLPDTRLLAPIKRQRFESEGGGWYSTGTAQAKIDESAQHQTLKERANTNCTRAFSMGECKFFANIPSLLECIFCKERNCIFKDTTESFEHTTISIEHKVRERMKEKKNV